MEKSESQVICGISINPKDDQKALKLMADSGKIPNSNAEYKKIHSGYQAFRLERQKSINVNNVLIAA